MIPFLDLKAQYQTIKEKIDEAVSKVISDAQFILGEEVEAFEEEFARYCESRYSVGVNSGTSALHLALLAADVGAGDEVITVPFTFAATAAAICYTGARPVFVDIDPRSRLIDATKIEEAITPRTKALVPVHLYGQCADMTPIIEIARRHGLVVIEDAAQAHGAYYKERRAGSLGDLACFSFYPGKNLGAYGEGGAVVTSNAHYVKRIRALRDHGQSRKYLHEAVGYNYRLEAVQGAVLRVKLRYLDEWNAARRAHASEYRRQLADTEVRLLEEMDYGRMVYHIFPVFTERRDQLQEHLKNSNTGTGIHYPIALHLQPAYTGLGYRAGDFPHSEQASAETLSLPMYAELSRDAIDEVACAVRDFFRRPRIFAEDQGG